MLCDLSNSIRVQSLINSDEDENMGKGQVLTGFKELDSFPVNGFRRGELIVMGAQSGMGKTDFAYSLVANVYHYYSSKCIFFNGTAPISYSAERLTDVFRNLFGEDLKDKVKSDRERIWFDDSSEIQMDDVEKQCRTIKEENGLDLVIIDNLQLIEDKLKDNRYSRIDCQSQVLRKLKSLAEEIDCPILVLSRLSRDIECRDEKRPWISDFEASDAVKKCADKVFLLYRKNDWIHGCPAVARIVFCEGENKAHYDGIVLHYDYDHHLFSDPDYSKTKKDVYEIDGRYYEYINWYEASRYYDRLYGSVRLVTEEEQRDISYLVEDKFVEFYNDPDSDCKGSSTGFLGSWNYPEIMIEFKEKVVKAYQATSGFGRIERKQPIWADMRDRYFDGKAYVYPDEMIQYLDKFNNKEIIAFLHYCTCYKERFCDGVYGNYAQDGYIGKLLIRLKDLPLILDI